MKSEDFCFVTARIWVGHVHEYFRSEFPLLRNRDVFGSDGYWSRAVNSKKKIFFLRTRIRLYISRTRLEVIARTDAHKLTEIVRVIKHVNSIRTRCNYTTDRCKPLQFLAEFLLDRFGDQNACRPHSPKYSSTWVNLCAMALS